MNRRNQVIAALALVAAGGGAWLGFATGRESRLREVREPGGSSQSISSTTPPMSTSTPETELAGSAAELTAARERWDRGFDAALALLLRRRPLELVDAALLALPLPANRSAAGARGTAPDPALAADLDEWSLLRRERRDLAGANDLVEHARALDPDPDRSRLRDWIMAEDVSAVRELARDPAIDAWPPLSIRLLGRALDCAGADDSAERLLTRAIGRTPDDFGLRITLADLLLREGPAAAERARIHYGAAQALRPDSLRAALHHAWLLSDQAEDPAAAIDVMAAATRRSPQSAVASFGRGLVLVQAGHTAEARTHLQRALELDPGFALAHATIGESWLKELEFEPAEAAFNKSLELADNAVAADGLAERFWADGKFERACELLEDAVQRHPQDALIRNHLADTLQLRGRSRDALMQYREAVHLDEWLAETQNDYAWELVNSADARLRRPGQALEHTQRACDMAPDDAWYRNTLGVTWYRLGDFDRCVAELEHACELPGGGGTLDWFFLAMAKEELGEHADALDCFSRAMARMDPENDEHVRAMEEAKELIETQEEQR